MTGPNHVYHFKHGWIPIDSYAANIKRQKTLGSAGKIAAKAGHAPSGHVEEDPKLTTLVNLREMGHPKYHQLLAKHQSEHGATSSAEKIAATTHTAPKPHREPTTVKAATTDRVSAAAHPGPAARGAPISTADRAHLAAAMDRGHLPEDMRQPVVEALSRQAGYPGVLKQIRTITVTRTGSSEFASFGHTELHLSRDLFNPNGEAAKASRTHRSGDRSVYLARIKAVEDGHASPVDALVAHESGHVVEDAIGLKGRVDAFTAFARSANLPEPVPVLRHYNDGHPPAADHAATVDDWFKSNKSVGMFLAKNLSQYGAGNPNEAFAEMWAVYSLDGAGSPAWIRAFGDNAVASLARRNP